MRALVLGGAGAVCQETTLDLAQYSDFEEIVVADYDVKAAQKLVDTQKQARLKAIYFDANNQSAMLELFPQFDIVVNGLPFKYDYAVNKACVLTGIHGLDLSSEDPQFDLDKQAEEKGLLFVPGMGATPGITNMMVRKAADRLDRLDEVEIYFAAFRCLAPAPGLLQTTLWEFNPEEQDRQEVYYEDGEWHSTPPLSGEIEVQFHKQIGLQKVYYVPHDEAYTMPRSFPSLRRAAVKGCFPPHVMEIMAALMKSGLLSSRPVEISDTKLPAIEVVRILLTNSPFSQQNEIWAYGLVVEVTGEKEGKRVRCTYRSQHPPQDSWGGRSAYFKNVGIPLSIGAQMIASGLGQCTGVKPPELAFPAEPFFEALSRRGITVEEEII